MIVVDTRTNVAHSNLSKVEAGKLVGVNRMTIARWELKRMQDASYIEVYNHFQTFFNVIEHKQKKGAHL